MISSGYRFEHITFIIIVAAQHFMQPPFITQHAGGDLSPLRRGKPAPGRVQGVQHIGLEPAARILQDWSTLAHYHLPTSAAPGWESRTLEEAGLWELGM